MRLSLSVTHGYSGGVSVLLVDPFPRQTQGVNKTYES